MTKSLVVTPEDWFKPGKITFKDIPVCQYKKTLTEEKKIYSKEDFTAIYHDMLVCHIFETVINELKLTIECKVVNTVTIGSHTQITGEVVNIQADESIIDVPVI